MEIKDLIKIILLVLAGGIGGVTFTNIITENYEQCRIGSTYGTWLSTNTQFLFKCDLTQKEQLCYKTTKTRCYLFDISKIETIKEVKVVSANGGIYNCDTTKPVHKYTKCIKGDGKEAYLGELI